MATTPPGLRDLLRTYLRGAVFGALPELAIVADPTPRIGQENFTIAPPADRTALWATETLRVGQERVEDNGDPQPRVALPFYQLTLMVQAGEGPARLDAAYAALARALPLNTPVLDATGTLQVTCETAEPGPVAVLTQPAGWAATAARFGLETFRRVDATEASVPLALPSIDRRAQRNKSRPPAASAYVAALA